MTSAMIMASAMPHASKSKRIPPMRMMSRNAAAHAAMIAPCQWPMGTNQ
jgi:hypothetical protein